MLLITIRILGRCLPGFLIPWNHMMFSNPRTRLRKTILIKNLVKLPRLSLNFAVQVEHCPVALDEPPTSGNVDRVPSVPVPRVHKLLTGQVLRRFTVAFHNLGKKI